MVGAGAGQGLASPALARSLRAAVCHGRRSRQRREPVPPQREPLAGTAPGQVIAADCAVGCQPFEGRAGCTPRVVAVGVRGRHVGIGGQVGQRIEGQVG